MAEGAGHRRALSGPRGASLLDTPVGTGRFLPFYKKYDFRVTGLDISLDMLAAAKRNATALGLDIALAKGDIRRIDVSDRSFEAALCVRFVNWVDFAGMEAALAELSRVARSALIVSVRVWPTPKTLVQRLGQRRTSFRRRRADLNFHNQEATEALFARLGFAIADSEVVRQRRDQTSYIHYLLWRTA
jgi:ubiquinone/menaquinone biosynthesis C-methylase UbiE